MELSHSSSIWCHVGDDRSLVNSGAQSQEQHLV